MRIQFKIIHSLDDRIWSVRLSPADARRLPGNPIDRGESSIVLVDEFGVSKERGALTAEIDGVRVVALGSTHSALIIPSSRRPRLTRKNPKWSGMTQSNG